MMNKDEDNNKGFNWGKGLFAVIVLFICATLSIVAFLVSLDYEMVTENHYEKAVKYQRHIEKVEHSKNLKEPVTIELLRANHKIQIKFPASLKKKSPTGTIKLYRPSNSDFDQQLELVLNSKGVQNISADQLARGKWLVQVNWTADSTSYFKEETIFL